MRVLMVSKALVVGAYHKKLNELVKLGIDIHLVLPTSWGGQQPEISSSMEYRISLLPVIFTGKNHFHLYRGLQDAVTSFRPDILHIDEEPYSVVTYQAMRIAKRLKIPSLFFAWQNILKKFPWPFSWIEQYNFHASHAAIAGNREAEEVLRKKGYTKKTAVIPQFGVDPEIFRPHDVADLKRTLFRSPHATVIGYGGRLLEEKGLMVLLKAFSALPAETFLLLMGDGPLKDTIKSTAAEMGVADRVVMLGSIPSRRMPEYLNCLTLLVLPSLTRPNWKEQFGRILVEAMACEVPVVGSTSGEIPNVIGNAGLVVPEGDVNALTGALQRLIDRADERKTFGLRGRERVLTYFTQRIVAEQTYRFYREILSS